MEVWEGGDKKLGGWKNLGTKKFLGGVKWRKKRGFVQKKRSSKEFRGIDS